MSWHKESKRHRLARYGVGSGRKKHVKVYHGTSRDNSKNIKEKGLKNPFVSTNIFTANWYGQHKGNPAVLELEVPEEDIYWSDWDGNIKKKADVSGIKDELDERPEDLYLLVKGDVKPENIDIMPEPKRLDSLAKEEKKWQKYWDER